MKKYNLLAAIIAFLTLSSAAQIIEQRPLITVRAAASVQASPDIVIIRIRIAGKVENGNVSGVDILNRSIAYESDFKLNIITDYDVKYCLEMLSGMNGRYMIEKDIVVTLNDIAKCKDFLKEIVKLNYIEVKKVEFRTTKLLDYRQQARLKAIEQAKSKANALAAAVGQSIGKVFSITENPTNLIEMYRDNEKEYGIGKPLITDDYLEYVGFISVAADLTVSFDLK